MSNIIELKKVSKTFRFAHDTGATIVFDHFDLSISKNAGGEIVVLLGISGGGKSTLLKLISGLIKPDAGEVRVLGDRVESPTSNSVLLPQAYTCFPWLSAIQNVEFGLTLKHIPKKERRKLAAEYLAKVGLADRKSAYPAQLSGGMQQRVAIARTLVLHPPIVLMDEPFGALDSFTRTQMQQLLLSLWIQEKNFILFVTHDVQEAILLADRIYVLPRPPVTKVMAELAIPFPRPRPAPLIYEPEFTKLAKQLRDMIEGSHPSGSKR